MLPVMQARACICSRQPLWRIARWTGRSLCGSYLKSSWIRLKFELQRWDKVSHWKNNCEGTAGTGSNALFLLWFPSARKYGRNAADLVPLRNDLLLGKTTRSLTVYTATRAKYWCPAHHFIESHRWDTRRQQEWNYLKLQSCPALCLEGQQSCERHSVIGERGRKKKTERRTRMIVIGGWRSKNRKG